MNDRATAEAYAELARRLSLNRHWVGAQFGWVLVWIWVNLAFLHFEGIQWIPESFSSGLGVSYCVSVMIAALLVQAGMLRSLIREDTKPVRLVWGSLLLLLWVFISLIAAEMQDYLPGQVLKWLLTWVVVPAIFFPFAAASSVWGWRLPWRRVLRVVCAWRWWLCTLLAGALGKIAETYCDSIRGYPKVWDVDLAAGLRMFAVDMLETAVWVLLLSWLALPFDRDARGIKQIGGDSTPLLLSDSGNGACGNA